MPSSSRNRSTRRRLSKSQYPVAERARPKPTPAAEVETPQPVPIPPPDTFDPLASGDDVLRSASQDALHDEPIERVVLRTGVYRLLDESTPPVSEASAELPPANEFRPDDSTSDDTLDAFPIDPPPPSADDTPAPRKGRLGILVLPGEPSRILPKPPAEPLPWNPTGAVIAREEFTEKGRFLRRYAPAWAISGVVHSVLALSLILLTAAIRAEQAPPPPDDQLAIVVEEPQKTPNLSNEDIGLDPTLEAAVAVETSLPENPPAPEVPAPTPDPGAVAQAPPMVDVTPPAGLGGDPSASPNLNGDVLAGVGRDGRIVGFDIATAEYAGRSAAGKAKLVKEGGGNDKSEAAVARGLAWVAKQQHKNGSWTFQAEPRRGRGRDRGEYVTAATGMSLLPFLAAGYTHRSGPDGKYQGTVGAGLNSLLKDQQADGSFAANTGKCMYSHAIATVALCEAYGMSGDRSGLQAAARKAVQYIIDAQDEDGSWGYIPRTAGDTSIVGWQIQALHSARLSQLDVPEEVFKKARKFLDRVSEGSTKATYGYRAPGATPTMTGVGLLCRNYLDNWSADHPGMSEGVKYLLKSPMKKGFDLYFLYYATQVVHFHGGEAWFKEWNPQIRDMLVSKQVGPGNAETSGSWDPDNGTIGGTCGRLGTTCLSLLTLEVYYRHLPLYKREAAERRP